MVGMIMGRQHIPDVAKLQILRLECPVKALYLSRAVGINQESALQKAGVCAAVPQNYHRKCAPFMFNCLLSL